MMMLDISDFYIMHGLDTPHWMKIHISLLLKDVIEDWSSLVGADGAPVPYTVANLGELLDNYPASAREIYAAYKAELTEAKRKNS